MVQAGLFGEDSQTSIIEHFCRCRVSHEVMAVLAGPGSHRSPVLLVSQSLGNSISRFTKYGDDLGGHLATQSRPAGRSPSRACRLYRYLQLDAFTTWAFTTWAFTA